MPYAAPEFAGVEAWLNANPLTMQSLKGKVVLIDFWTYSCINCVRTLPHITDWDRKYRDKGLVIIGVHAPEFEFEKKLDNVKAALAQHGIRYPVALDNKLSTWMNFENRYWPAHYLIDRDGKVVYTHFGEGKYDVTENNIRYLLGLKNDKTVKAETPISNPDETAETYLGYARASGFGGDKPMAHNREMSYRFPDALAEDEWALSGKWRVDTKKITSGEKGAALRLDFNARKVFLVLGTATGEPVNVTIRLNGETRSTLTVERNTLYELIDQQMPKNGLLEVTPDAPGLEAYAFTFG
jgi:thiol-disulfide isomerase/thioredoxin